MKKVILVLMVCLLSACYAESYQEKKNRIYWEKAPIITPMRIEQLKDACAKQPNLYQTYVIDFDGPKGVACRYRDVSVGSRQDLGNKYYDISARLLLEEQNQVKEGSHE